MHRPFYFISLFLAGILFFINSCSSSDVETEGLQPFHLSSVRLLESPFSKAAELNEAYVMAHDLDRLLAPFLIDAGFEPKAPRYGNWESMGLDGHTGGHFLSALSLMVASEGSEEAGHRLDYMLSELARCQEAHGNGYVGGIPGGSKMWEDIAAGRIHAANFSLNGKWVPLYNIHKLFAGLRDAWLYAGREQALEMLIDLSDWCYQLVSNLSDEQMQNMLVSEHGGMNEVLADLYAINGDERYLELARRFSHNLVLEPLLRHEDKLTGMHANTQIPKVIGFMRIAELTGDKDWESASDFFWETVVNHRTGAIGGNSTHEHFHPVDDFSSMVETREGPETCNTHNMLKLSKQLYFAKGGDLKYIDYYERSLYNHILTTIHPQHGGLVYFTSLRPGHYRVYSNPEHTFWCCVGSGIENHSKYGELIYTHNDDDLFVNLFIPSVLNWEEKGLGLIQNTSFPESEETTLTIKTNAPIRSSINIRHPEWVKTGSLELYINGKKKRVKSKAGEYVSLKKKWKDGDQIRIVLPMYIYGEELPDHSPFMALLYGPVVLSAVTDTDDLIGLVADDSRMGHVAHGPLRSREEAPVLIIDDETWPEKVKPMEGKPLTFSANELIFPSDKSDMELIPFYKLHDARYIVYWQISNSDEANSAREELLEKEKLLLELEEQTIDHLQTGQQQPESEHNFKGENTETGIHQNRHWRHAHAWFSYDLNNPENEAKALRITYYGLDKDRSFDILVNNILLETVHLDGSVGDKFFDVDYELPAELTEGNQNSVINVTFKAHEGSIAGGVFYVRLMR